MNDDEDEDDGILRAVSAGLNNDSSGIQDTWELLIERPLALWTISSLPFASIHRATRVWRTCQCCQYYGISYSYSDRQVLCISVQRRAKMLAKALC
jgi:hypothetical protein